MKIITKILNRESDGFSDSRYAKAEMQPRRQKMVVRSIVKKLVTGVSVLSFVLIPLFAVPLNIHSAPDGNVTKRLPLAYSLFSDQSPLTEGFSYWKKEYPSVKDWFEPRPDHLSRIDYYEKLVSERSKAMAYVAAANDDQLSPLKVTPLVGDPGLTIDRVVSTSGFQQISATASPGGSTKKIDHWSILRTDYILLAFGLIGYIVVRRRTTNA